MFGENSDDTGAGSRTRPKFWTPSAEMRRIDFQPIECSTCGEGPPFWVGKPVCREPPDAEWLSIAGDLVG
jgi:hypothetical protein